MPLLNFLRAPKRVRSRDQLLDEEGECSDNWLDRSIDIRVSRLRRKVGDYARNPRIIKTVYGAGYLMAANIACHNNEHTIS